MIIKKDRAIIGTYFEDASNIAGGHSDMIMIPESHQETADIIREANQNRTPLTISGGGTGTCGGRIPLGEPILSTEKLNRLLEVAVNGSGGYAVCEAGLPIYLLKDNALKKGLFYAYDPTEQTCFVGGTIATNASGARSFKYGSTRNSVIGLKAVLPNGDILEVKRGQIKADNGFLKFSTNSRSYAVPIPKYKMPKTKNSAGYFASDDMDLIDLFIGQEGTLACVLQATLRLHIRPEGIFSCFAFFNDNEKALAFAKEAGDISLNNRMKKQSFINALSVEYADKNSLHIIREHASGVPDNSTALIYFEQETGLDNEESIVNEWAYLLNRYGVSESDTWVAMNEKDRCSLAKKRHCIAEYMNDLTRKNNFPKVATDLAVPRKAFPSMMKFYREQLAQVEMENFLFGHIGDSHLHMDLFPRTEKEYISAKHVALKFIRKSVSLGGTVSAEHGIGKLRKEYLHELYGYKGISQMIAVKKALDPNLILGRGNIFDV